MKKLATIALCALMAISASAQKTDEAEYNQYGQKVESHPVQASVQDGILVFQNKKQNYKIWFDTRIQADAGFFFGAPDWCEKPSDGSVNSNHIGNGMSLRRTRFAVKAQLGKNWYGEFDTDWTSGTPEIKDAIIRFTGLKDFQFNVGNFKEDFAMVRNTTSRYLLFMERPMVAALTPSRHLGIDVQYSHNWAWAAAGVFGPELGDSEAQTYMEDGNKAGYDEGMSYTGKFAYRPFYKSTNHALSIGAAFSYRQPKLTGGADGYNCVRYSTRNSTNINRKKYLDTDAISGVDHELAWTVEAGGYVGGFRYQAAYIARGAFLNQATKDKGGYDKGIWMKGWYVDASYLLFGGKQNFDYEGNKPTRIDPGKKWGDLELALRYQRCDFNCPDANVYGGAADMFTVGVNFYPTRNVKIMLNYSYVNNDRYANGKGKLYVGHDASGAPTADYTKVVESDGKAGVDYSQLTMRFQVAF